MGDSIGFNSSADCPGCTGFVQTYGAALKEASGLPVKVLNLTEHNGLQVDMLLRELDTSQARRDSLASADAIIVAVSFNDIPMNRDDDPCDGDGDPENWKGYDDACMKEVVKTFRPKYDELYERIAALRAGKPTILRTANRYNDWIGGDGVPPEANAATKLAVDAWNKMICASAEKHGFVCADIYHAFNGPDGTQYATGLLAADYTHPSDKGNAVIAKTLVDLGFAPLAP